MEVFYIKKEEFPSNDEFSAKKTKTLKKEFSKSLRKAKKADKLNHRDIGERHWGKCFSIYDELKVRD